MISLDLANDNLTGTLLASMTNFTQLQALYLQNNQLSGAIPPAFGNFPNLLNLDLADNQLSGTIPSTLGSLANLQYLGLSDNQFNGTIPASLGNLGSLQVLGLKGNQISGTVPDFTGFKSVSVNIEDNYLTISAGSQSLANINAMIAAGNTVAYSPQNPQPALGGTRLLAGGGAQMTLTCLSGQTYTMQASTNLTTWTSLTNLTLMSTNSVKFVDPSASNDHHRFYRAIVTP